MRANPTRWTRSTHTSPRIRTRRAEVERLRDVAAGLGAAGALRRPPVACATGCSAAAAERVAAGRAPTKRWNGRPNASTGFSSTIDDADLERGDRERAHRARTRRSTSRRSTARSSPRPTDPDSALIGAAEIATITAADLPQHVDESFAETVDALPPHAGRAGRAARRASRPTNAIARLRPRRHARDPRVRDVDPPRRHPRVARPRRGRTGRRGDAHDGRARHAVAAARDGGAGHGASGPDRPVRAHRPRRRRVDDRVRPRQEPSTRRRRGGAGRRSSTGAAVFADRLDPTTWPRRSKATPSSPARCSWRPTPSPAL